MNEMSNRTAGKIKKMRTVIALLTAFSVLICAVGAVGLAFMLRREKNYREAINRQYNIINEKQRIIDEEMIPITKFKDYATRYGVSIHFVQQFLSDCIVYNNDYGMVFAPVDDTLKMNSIDTSDIVDMNGRRTYPENDDYTVKTAVDVSQYQGNINWNSVAADGVDAAFIRVGYRGYGAGELKTDSYYYANISGALSAGLDVGVYFFSQAITTEEAVAEADYVLSKISGYNVTLPIVFDMEEISGADARANNLSAKEITDITIAFCERIKAAGHTPMVYGNVEWMCDHLEYSRLEGYAKWFAQYSTRFYFPYDIYAWQYTESGKVNGISGGADVNLIFLPKN